MRVIIISREGIMLILGGLLLATLLLMIYITLFTNVWRVQSGLTELRVLIDPGHGGVDGGTRDSQDNLEKQINLLISLRLRDHLCQSGLHVILSRETDRDLAPFSLMGQGRHLRDLMARIRKARENQCQFLVSIHCDWSENQYKQGARVFYYPSALHGRRLADLIQVELNKLNLSERKASPGDFFILKQQGVTGVIVEVGMLSNHHEAEMLQSPSYQEQLALAIARGILNFCRNYLPAEPPAFNNLLELEKME